MGFWRCRTRERTFPGFNFRGSLGNGERGRGREREKERESRARSEADDPPTDRAISSQVFFTSPISAASLRFLLRRAARRVRRQPVRVPPNRRHHQRRRRHSSIEVVVRIKGLVIYILLMSLATFRLSLHIGASESFSSDMRTLLYV